MALVHCAHGGFSPEGTLVECHPGTKRFSKSSHVLASFQCSLMALWALPRCSKLRVHLVCQTFRCSII